MLEFLITKFYSVTLNYLSIIKKGKELLVERNPHELNEIELKHNKVYQNLHKRI